MSIERLQSTHPRIEQRLCLKDRIEIIYIVDGFCAMMIRGDESTIVEGEGPTIELALDAMEAKLEQWLEDNS